jgi:membrane-associated phospholipid phosphatase
VRFLFEKFTVATLIIAASAFLFLYVDRLNASFAASGAPFTGLELWIDAYIPFVPQFIYFYFLYYLWVLIVLPILNERESFYHAAAAFTIIQAAAITTFIVFPSFMVRPEVVGDSLAHEMVRFIYREDKGFNLVPSLHVGHSTLIALFFRAYKPKHFPWVAFGTLMISVSTVLVKQHYIIDIPIGFLFALGSFYLASPVTQWVASRAKA